MRLILAILLLALYIFSSWWCWWFGGAFGYRSLVEFYALLAFPFAYFSTIIFQSKWVSPKLAFLVLLIPLLYYNLEMSKDYANLYQAHYTWDTFEQNVEGIFPTFED